MKVLVITRNAWDDTNSVGNTISNFFSGIDDIEFSNIYFRSAKPHNKLCKRYFKATEAEILKNWFSSEKIGKEIILDDCEEARKTENHEKKEKALINFIHKYGIKTAYKVSDILWYSKKWMNKKLENFIESVSPDVVFTFVKASPQYYLTVKYLREKFNIPVISWIADDEYTVFLKNGSEEKINNLKYILKESSVIFGCSEEICEYYNSVFGCKSDPLYKSCDFSADHKKHINEPLKIIYAGNLLYGRLECIKEIAKKIEEIDPQGKKICFEIYSNTLISSEEKTFFKNKKCTEYLGCRNYEFIKRCLAEADVVLHTESFEEEQILKTKYSFSTKIIDYLQSGSVLLAIGPEEIASIKYIKKIPGTFVIDDLCELGNELKVFFSESKEFMEKAEKTRNFARKYHDSLKNSEKIEKAIKMVAGDRL